MSTEGTGRGDCPYCGEPRTVARSGSGWGECAVCGRDTDLGDVSGAGDGVVPQPTPPLPDDWKRRRIARIIQANYRCEEKGCSVRHDPPRSVLEVHHVVARRHGGTHDLDNLVALCHYHHLIRTRGENESDELHASMNTEYRPKMSFNFDELMRFLYDD